MLVAGVVVDAVLGVELEVVPTVVALVSGAGVVLTVVALEAGAGVVLTVAVLGAGAGVVPTVAVLGAGVVLIPVGALVAGATTVGVLKQVLKKESSNVKVASTWGLILYVDCPLTTTTTTILP